MELALLAAMKATAAAAFSASLSFVSNCLPAILLPPLYLPQKLVYLGLRVSSQKIVESYTRFDAYWNHFNANFSASSFPLWLTK